MIQIMKIVMYENENGAKMGLGAKKKTLNQNYSFLKTEKTKK